MSKLYTADRFVTTGGTTAQYVTGTGSLVTFPPIPSGADYIQNQNASAQSANMWISGSGTFNSSVTVGGSYYGVDNANLIANNVNTNGTVLNLNSKGTVGVITLQTNSTERMRITSDGNVGIGTSSPGDKLVISGTNVFARVSNSSAGDGGIKISYQNSDTHGLHLLYNPGSAISYIDNTYPISSGQVYGDVYFRQNVGGTMTPRLSIKADSGNVGIGTTGPVSSLQVSKDQAADTAITVTNAGTVGSTTSMSFVLQEAGTPLGWFRRYRDGSGLNEIGFSNDLSFSGNIATTKVERMRITSSGNVGIGTSSPGQLLTLSGLENPQISIVSNNTAGNSEVYFGDPGAVYRGAIIYAHNGDSLNFHTAASEKMRITSAGNVGIGTSSPDYKLDVNGITRTSNDVSNRGGTLISTKDIGGAVYLYNDNGSNTGAVRMMSSYLNGGTLYNPNFSIDRSTNSVAYGGNVEGLTYVSSLVIDGSSGNVGIGTTSPGYQLSLSKAGSTFFQVENTSTLNSVFYGNSGGNGWIETTGAYATVFQNNGSERMRITSAGNVGIGTTSPSEKLEVNGSIRLSDGNADGPQLKLASSGYSDWNLDNYNGSFRAYYGSSEYFRITGSGNVGIGTTAPNAKLDVNGDALINQLTIGQGPVVGQGNTALGKGALGSMVGGKANIAVGSNANSDNDVTGLTVIGVDLNVNPAGSALTQNSLVIGQYNALNYSTQYPHIYAPDKVNCPNGNTTTDVIAVDYSVYTAIFMEYSIFNSAGDQFRAGTYTAAFKSTGTVVDDDNQTVVYSGTTLSATFTTSISGSVATIQLRNQDSDTYDIRVTARLLMR